MGDCVSRDHRSHRSMALVRLAAAAVLAAVGSLPLPSHAQQPPSVEELSIELRPEYDRSSVLVIYWLRLADDTPLPATVSVPIPASVGEPFAVGIGQAEEGLPLSAVYNREVVGDWATIIFETESLTAQVEFYQDLSIQDSTRSYTFTWPGGVDVGSMSYLVQHPVGSSAVQITPPPDQQTAGADGMTYSQAALGPRSADSTVRITLAYVKAGTGLSMDALQPAGALEVTGSVAGDGLGDWLPWLLLVVGLVLLGGGGLWFWRANRVAIASRKQPRRRGGPSQVAGQVELLDASAVYCHECGAAAGVSDRFCRRCGTRLRQ